MSNFSLFLQRKYPEALKAFEETAQAGNLDAPFLNNRGFIFLGLGDPARARLDFEKSLSLDPQEPKTKHKRWHSDYHHNAIGTTYWLEGNRPLAIHWWSEIVEALSRGRVSYSDSSGGVGSGLLLWFGAARTFRKDARGLCQKLFEKMAGAKRPRWGGLTSWPGPIAGLFLGTIDEATLMKATATVPGLDKRYLCQAYFARGVAALERGQPQEYRNCMKLAAGLPSPAHIEEEFFLASYESTLPDKSESIA